MLLWTDGSRAWKKMSEDIVETQCSFHFHMHCTGRSLYWQTNIIYRHLFCHLILFKDRMCLRYCICRYCSAGSDHLTFPFKQTFKKILTDRWSHYTFTFIAFLWYNNLGKCRNYINPLLSSVAFCRGERWALLGSYHNSVSVLWTL